MSAALRILLSCLLGSALLVACDEPREPVSLSAPGTVATPTEPEEDAAVAFSDRAESGRLRIVGSSTVFPFITTVAESFGVKSGFGTPVVEPTGTGGGMNLFCSGLGARYPDFTAASRRMKPTEFQLCQDNGVTDIVEIPIGFDGIVLGNSIESESMDIAKGDLFLALAARTPMPVDAQGAALVDASGRLLDGASLSDVRGYDCAQLVANPYTEWSQINPALPAARIQVFGPPPTSGTRDAFVELDMIEGARRIECLADMAVAAPGRFEEVASRIREDGRWVDSGENDNAIVQTLTNAPESFGIFGYSFLEQNGDRIQASRLDGVEPTYENISNGVYPSSRSLYIYAKAQHVDFKPGLREFIEELTHEDAWGPYGYLAGRGLIALPESRRDAVATQARDLMVMDQPG